MLDYEVYDAADALFEERFPEVEQHEITAEEWAAAEAAGFTVGQLVPMTQAEHEDMLMLQDWKMELQAQGQELPDDEAYTLNHLEGLALASNCGCEACYELRKQMQFDREVSMFGFAA